MRDRWYKIGYSNQHPEGARLGVVATIPGRSVSSEAIDITPLLLWEGFDELSRG